MAIPSPLELLFPPKCIICQKILTGRETICPECARSLPVATGAQVKHKVEFTEGCYAPFFYEEPLRSAFLRYKFSGREHYATSIGNTKPHTHPPHTHHKHPPPCPTRRHAHGHHLTIQPLYL